MKTADGISFDECTLLIRRYNEKDNTIDNIDNYYYDNNNKNTDNIFCFSLLLRRRRVRRFSTVNF